ncbi:hypothetical protein H4W80_005518 [Nonomuraea angiospora]|uniref:Uncharacterized protein n=1 Tax=Nonomuraea angiospora TaxID=46172 RepID=A0ABR9M3T8_9ACTN|nr:hypothetical protein [Nonomuraea angiospora]
MIASRPDERKGGTFEGVEPAGRQSGMRDEGGAE